MRKRRKLLVLLLTVLLVGVFGWVLSRDREPRYAGRTFSSWVGQYDAFSKDREAAEAIQRIGSNAVPHLLRTISYTQPKWKRTTMSVLHRLTAKFPSTGPFIPRALIEDRSIRQEISVIRGFEALGPAAESAVPRLTELALDTNAARSEASQRAVAALCCIRPYPKAAINRLLSEGSAQTRTMTLGYPFCLKDPSLTTDLLPSLIKCVHEGRGDVLMLATVIITELKYSDPKGTLGILTNLVSSPRPEVRQRVIQCIATFGPYGPPVMPYLRQFLTDPDPHVRREASNAVWAAENGLLSQP